MMLILLSFVIFNYVASKINRKKQIQKIESDFEDFKLAATNNDSILNAVKS